MKNSQDSHDPELGRYEVMPAGEYGERAVEGPPSSSTAAKPTERQPGKTAIFVAHGMGQQIPWQTLDAIASGLIEQQPDAKTKVRAVRSDETLLRRIELDLEDSQGEPRKVDVYEGYWAPLTEGQVTLRDVMGFLFNGATNGWKNGATEFRRKMFDLFPAFPAQARIFVYLAAALAAVVSLIVLNSTIVLVAAARSPLKNDRPRWLGNGLFTDLTTLFHVVLVVALVFGLVLFCAKKLRQMAKKSKSGALWKLVRAWNAMAVGWFVLLLFVLPLAALTVPLLFYGHVKPDAQPNDSLWLALLHRPACDSLIDGFNGVLNGILLGGLAAVLVGWVGKAAWTVARALRSELLWHDGKKKAALSAVVVLLGLVLIGLAGVLIRLFVGLYGTQEGDYLRIAQLGIAWPLLLGVSWWVRGFLVQYLGDVALYVTSHRLDRFRKLRDEIRQTVLDAARPVYALRSEADPTRFEYDRVLVVGHSLGSVVVYDTLNRLFNDDLIALPGQDSLQAIERTKLLVTFGSPLDKLAFLFSVAGHATTEAREALTNAAEPMIQRYQDRPRWVNLFSRWDIIGGGLDFFDLPGKSDPRSVHDEIDLEATTLLAAHTEYWENSLLYRTLLQSI
ncbi:MAG TPA: hypothetical protein VN851_14120 [Thermoanaerobaculia bacterium]|nr:hypothetical protein [Thermoanaerobaculia bacterium]